jgi:hypothetical protein
VLPFRWLRQGRKLPRSAGFSAQRPPRRPKDMSSTGLRSFRACALGQLRLSFRPAQRRHMPPLIGNFRGFHVSRQSAARDRSH